MTHPPANPNLSVPARRLLAFLQQLKGKGILSGQHDYLEAPDVYPNQIFGLTGKYPAVHGYEMGPIMGQSAVQIAQQRNGVVDSAIRWHNAGGIVTMMFHAHYPGMAPLWANVQRATTEQEFNQIVTPGTALYNNLIRDIDQVAEFLKRLRDAGVPVLWRPYHEMNGGWFWWGRKSRFADLWNIMFDRYTNYHNLNNLIWVWNPNAPNAYADPYDRYYPGHDKVDVLAADIYNNDYKKSHHDQLVALGGGKPIAIGENGELPNPQTLQTSQPNWTWFMTWGKMLRDNNSDATIRSVYAHPYVLTRDEVDRNKFPDPADPGQPTDPTDPTQPGQPTDPTDPTQPGQPTDPTQPGQPTDPTQPGQPPAKGLKGEYYAGVSFNQLLLTRIDDTVNFDWARQAPADGLPVDDFSVRWTGAVVPQYDGEYTFYVFSDDGARLWVDGKLIIDKWVDQYRTEWSGKIRLTAGKAVPVRLDYYERAGDALVTLSWSHARRPKQVIPQSALLTAVPAATDPTDPTQPGQPTDPTQPGQPAVNGLKGEYYAGVSFNQLRLTRIDDTVNFDWARQAPADGLPVDDFSVRWTGAVVPQYDGEYTFYVFSDDGARLWVDGKLIIDKWVDQYRTEWSGKIRLTAGKAVPIRLDYYERAGDALVTLSWSHARQPKQVIPQSALLTAVPAATDPTDPTQPGQPTDPTQPGQPAVNGLKGEYYAGVSFNQLRLTRIDDTVNFDWARQAPAAGLPVDDFSVRWTGTVLPEFDGEYTFYVFSDDGARLWVDGKLIIDKWVDQYRTEWSGKIRLTAGKAVPIRLDYYERAGDALVTLSWSHARRPKQVIPKNRLFTTPV